MTKKEKSIYISAGIVLCVAFFIAGVYIGIRKQPEANKVANISNIESDVVSSADFDVFWKAWNILDKKFISSSETNSQDRIWGAIHGLTSSFNDPYTEFFDPAETKDFKEEISGEFSGVGLEVDIKDKVLTVIAPVKDSPAFRAGIKAGDKILKIDDAITSDLSLSTAVSKIRGDAGTNVILTIFRDGEKHPREYTLMREVINVPILDTKIEGDAFILSVYSFTGTNTNRKIEQALNEFAHSGKKKLILDLRGNPGGYLDSAVYTSSFFLPEGKIVVTEDYGTNGDKIEHRSSGYPLFNNLKPKIAVLIDSGSASASEIVAGALHDNAVAILVGEKTFGKGSVQEVVPITDKTILKVTVAHWLTPNGISIQKNGIAPDYEVKQNPDTEKDEVLDKAIELLK